MNSKNDSAGRSKTDVVDHALATLQKSDSSPATAEDASQGDGATKLAALDGLAEDQRNPLAPPINITANG
jgi:hypothetical protein